MERYALCLQIPYRITFGSLLVLVSFLAIGCRSPEGISINEAWGRPSPRSAANAAFYMNIQNHGPEMVSLLGADIKICGSTELHESIIDENGVMRMEQIDRIVIPAGSTVQLKPGGLHIMCIERQAELQPGDSINITLEFLNLAFFAVEATIRDQ